MGIRLLFLTDVFFLVGRLLYIEWHGPAKGSVQCFIGVKNEVHRRYQSQPLQTLPFLEIAVRTPES